MYRLVSRCVALVCGLAGAVAPSVFCCAEEPTKPNVLFILADDLGWADTTLYGHTKFYRTPNIERLAKRGMTFTRAYSASPLCSPTRSAILTGLSPARTGITTPACHLPQVVLEAGVANRAPAGDKAIGTTTVTRLKTDYPTLSKSLRAAGYATSHFGKWHLGHEPYSPLEQGFDVDVPHWPGPGPAGSYVAPWRFPDFDADPDVPDQHIEDRMAKEAVAWMEQHQDVPFFVNYWMFSVHAPFDAKQALIEKYRQRVDPADPQRSPTYAAMIESMDDAVGTLLDTLDRLGLSDNTIIVFTSDNGGNMYNEVDGTTPTSNDPLRGGKATMFEGGVRMPCVVVWPGRVQSDSRTDTMVQSEDFYPTLLDALQLKPETGQIFDGVSILPALKGEPFERGPIFNFFPHSPGVPDWLPPAVAVHEGDWKLIRLFHQGDDGAHRYLLYNLREDLSEKHNLAEQEPQRVRDLDALIEKFLTDTGAVVPIPNPNFDPAQYHPESEGVQKIKKQAPPQRAAKDDVSDPKLQGWKARYCTAKVEAGIVTVTSESTRPFLGVGAGVAGPTTARFRTRCEQGGRGRVEWIPPGGTPKSLPVQLSAGDWQENEIAVPAEGAIGIFRIYLPAQQQPVELDWVELRPEDGKPRRWDF